MNQQSSCPETNVTPVKPIDGFSARWDIIRERILAADRRMDLIVVGGGAGGCELALSMQARLKRELRGKDHVGVTVLTRGKTIMTSHNAKVRDAMTKIMESRGIRVACGASVASVKDGAAICEDGQSFPADEIVWCTQAGAASWLASIEGLKLDDAGFIRVDEHMETSVPGIFACGDIASLPDARPKAGVFAVRAGPHVASNLRALLEGVDRRQWSEYHPQASFLGLIGTGDKSVCVASRGNLCLTADWTWDLKDWIDRKWMAGYTYALPSMDDSEGERSLAGVSANVADAAGEDAICVLSHASMRCGGCGAKVGASTLSRVMQRLVSEFGGVPTRPEVLVGLDAPDDGAVVRAPSSSEEEVLVHTVDFFRSMVDDPFVFGQIAAQHALSDCHAMGAQPVSALAIAVIPYAVETIVQHQLYQIMAGACRVLKESGCALVGGHTCEGRELALGFAVNGVARASDVLSKGGVQPAKIILTKALGTGVLLAAEMRRLTSGVAWKAAVESMLQSNKRAAEIVREHGARACTDVTGFGALGHLVEMLRGSSPPATASLTLSAVPLLPGAQHCVDRGIFSSLQPANLRLKRAVRNEGDAKDLRAYPLLFDPQTSGGLLACVPADEADACIEALRAEGYAEAAVIGEIGHEVGIPGSGAGLITISE